MTPKQAYEARKAERAKIKDMDHNVHERSSMIMMIDTFDRFATAMERIAEAMERPQAQASNLTFDPNSASGFKVANTFGGK